MRLVIFVYFADVLPAPHRRLSLVSAHVGADLLELNSCFVCIFEQFIGIFTHFSCATVRIYH